MRILTSLRKGEPNHHCLLRSSVDAAAAVASLANKLHRNEEAMLETSHSRHSQPAGLAQELVEIILSFSFTTLSPSSRAQLHATHGTSPPYLIFTTLLRPTKVGTGGMRNFTTGPDRFRNPTNLVYSHSSGDSVSARVSPLPQGSLPSGLVDALWAIF